MNKPRGASPLRQFLFYFGGRVRWILSEKTDLMLGGLKIYGEEINPPQAQQ